MRFQDYLIHVTNAEQHETLVLALHDIITRNEDILKIADILPPALKEYARHKIEAAHAMMDQVIIQ